MTLSTELALHVFRFKCLAPISMTINFWMNGMMMQMQRTTDKRSLVHLTFQYTTDSREVKVRFEADKHQHHSQGDKATYVAPRAPHDDVTLVVYVASVSATVRRLIDCGFKAYVTTFVVNEWVRGAIVVDPNGIRIRLLESDLFPFNHNKSVARIGYASLPIANFASIERTVAFYNETFGEAGDGDASGGNAGGTGGVGGVGGKGGIGGGSGVGGGLSDVVGISATRQSTLSSVSSSSASSSPLRASLARSATSASSLSSPPGTLAPSRVAPYRVVDVERFVEEAVSFVVRSAFWYMLSCLLFSRRRQALWQVGVSRACFGIVSYFAIDRIPSLLAVVGQRTEASICDAVSGAQTGATCRRRRFRPFRRRRH
jgi:hypothetical protein